MPLLKQIAEQLRDADNFLVLAHVSPDGDALGSMLAMGELLDALGKKVVLFNESGIPSRFEWLAPKREILTQLPEDEPDNLIVLDCGSAERAGELIAPWLKTKRVFNIDHHLGNPPVRHRELGRPARVIGGRDGRHAGPKARCATGGPAG